MEVPWPQPWALGLLLVLLNRSWGAEPQLSLLYHLTAVTNPAPGTPAFWASGWLGPQQYLSYSSLRPWAEPCGAWVWESQVPWYWEKETTDLKSKEKLFKDAIQALGKDPQVLQGLLGCELAPDNSSVPTAIFALNGEEFMRFNPRMSNWTGNWPETLTIGQLWMKQADTVWKERDFLLSSCPQRLLGHLERGRGNLEWKEPPSMRLRARPSSPGFSVITCSAFSFYPPELQLRFLRNGMAAGTGNASGFGPNGDGSFHAWSSLIVKSGDEHHYRCLVQHKGLAKPFFVELESPAKSSVPVAGIVLGFLVFVAAAGAGGALLWWRMRRGLSAPWISLRGDDDDSLLSTPSLPQDADPQDINVSA
ncbi:IgG receptor FcRn large subunit p51 [Dipodomys spectabilis]|uniref:IgG receptor FcRn large subunit p51 n=1 Tax=Dipodomys spectabilis TaxID=105255 RepID=UPI001C542A4C|nr:IgG receptor FcRn large subunit p51 [Dipodomys spectabilis]XP_042556198.1 IgG receptor FcRn large subunit p51 [Dipodomys spectabilis]